MNNTSKSVKSIYLQFKSDLINFIVLFFKL